MKIQRNTTQKRTATQQPGRADSTLDTTFFDHHERHPIEPHAPPEGAFRRWLSLDQVRKMQRMRRTTVIQAMESGELPFERRGRIRYARLCDVLLWEQRRLAGVFVASKRTIDPDLADFVR